MMGARGLAWRTAPIVRAVVVLVVAGLGGCALVGYDSREDARPATEDLPADKDGDTAGGPSPKSMDAGGRKDARPPGKRDAAVPRGRPGPDGSMDAGTADTGAGAGSNDAASDGAREGGLDASADAGMAPDSGFDAGFVGDGSPPSGCPGSENACGGCGALAAEPGDPCGVCVMGSYVCDGPDVVVCEGGSKPPAVPAGGVLVEDFEDGDRFIRTAPGFDGFWYTTKDQTAGVITPAPGEDPVPEGPGAGGSNYAMRVEITTPFTAWGSTLTTYLNHAASEDDDECGYDVSAVSGLRFAARASASFWVRMASAETTSAVYGGNCDVVNPLADCNDHFQARVAPSTSWATYEVPWSSLSQSGTGTEFPAFAPEEVLYIEFLFEDDTTMWFELDDVGFY